MAGQTMRLRWMGVLAAALLSGCAALEKRVEQPQVKLNDVRVVAASLADAQLAFDLEVYNPNPLSLLLQGLSYELQLEDKSLLSGELGDRLRIGAGGRSRVTLPFTLRYAEVLGSLAALGRNEAIDYRLSGKADFGLFAIPYAKAGTLPLPRLPEVSVQSLRVERLTATGAQLALGLKVNNANGFSVRFSGFDYRLNLGEASVLQGESANPLSVQANQAGIVQVRLAVDFRQVAELARALQGRSLPIAFSGQLKLPEAGEEVSLPYHWQGEVPLLR